MQERCHSWGANATHSTLKPVFEQQNQLEVRSLCFTGGRVSSMIRKINGISRRLKDESIDFV
jgi:hypothetical protein